MVCQAEGAFSAVYGTVIGLILLISHILLVDYFSLYDSNVLADLSVFIGMTPFMAITFIEVFEYARAFLGGVEGKGSFKLIGPVAYALLFVLIYSFWAIFFLHS